MSGVAESSISRTSAFRIGASSSSFSPTMPINESSPSSTGQAPSAARLAVLRAEEALLSPSSTSRVSQSPRRSSIDAPHGEHQDSTSAADMTSDYDRNRTSLYRCLEESNWEEAMNRCRQSPSEAKTWIIRKATDGSIRWRLLPLHAAIIFQAPISLIQALLETYPAAIACTDDQGMLPLHLAFRHHSKKNSISPPEQQRSEKEALLEHLLRHNPKAVQQKDKKGRIPLEHDKNGDFSGKTLRLYSHAVVACTVSVPSTGGGNEGSSEPSANDLVATGMPTQTQAPVQPTQAVLFSAEKEKYEQKISVMKSSYEEHLELLTKQHQEELDKLQRVAEEERHTLTAQHYQEMDVMRSLLTSEKQKDDQVYLQLQEEVGDLRAQIEDVQSSHLLTQTSLHESQAQNESLLNQLKAIQSEHRDLGALLAQQQLDLVAAHKSRQHLLQELLQQEEKVRQTRVQGGIEVMQISERIRHQMDRALTGLPDDDGGEEPAVHAGPSDENTGGGQDYLEELRDDISDISDGSNF